MQVVKRERSMLETEAEGSSGKGNSRDKGVGAGSLYEGNGA